MHDLLRSARELVWPVNGGPRAHGPNADRYLAPVVFLAIVLLAGPDLLAAVELTTLLDLLGATLFIMAFLVGHKMLAAAFVEFLRQLFLPSEFVTLLKLHRQPAAMAFGALAIVFNGFVVFIIALAPVFVIRGLLISLA